MEGMLVTTSPAEDEPAQPPRPGASPTQRSVAALITVLGSILILGLLAIMVLTITLRSAASSSEQAMTVPTDGVETLRINGDAGSVTVEFGDVDEAQMAASGRGADRWSSARPPAC